jgi:hypothetical protein
VREGGKVGGSEVAGEAGSEVGSEVRTGGSRVEEGGRKGAGEGGLRMGVVEELGVLKLVAGRYGRQQRSRGGGTAVDVAERPYWYAIDIFVNALPPEE